jgi:hypothetical protein
MVVETVCKETLEGTPHPTRPQVSPIPRRQYDLGALGLGTNVVRALSHRDAVLDAELLDEDVKANEASGLG